MVNRIRVGLAFVSGGASVIVAIKQGYLFHAIEKLKRRDIKHDTKLNIAAIEKAADVVNQRIDNGEIRSLQQLSDSLRTEINFQQIAIREDI